MLKLDAAKAIPTEKKVKKTVVYISPKGENVMENFVNRRFRPTTLYRTVLAEGLLKADIGLTAERAQSLAETAKWDRFAGCSSCPCSPGFKLDHHSRLSVYLEVSSDVVNEDRTV